MSSSLLFISSIVNMGIAQSKFGIPKEKLKFKQKFEHCKDSSREEDGKDDSKKEDGTFDSGEEDFTDDSREEDGTDVSGEEDFTDDSREEDGINDGGEHGTDGSGEKDGTDGSREKACTDDTRVSNCNKKDEASLFYGTHESEVSEGGEADLHKHVVSCRKNPGHTQFVPIKDFNINHLPKGHHDNDLVEFIKATADLTVRVSVKVTSTERPEFWPNTNQPYPFYDKRGSDVMRLGTGMVCHVNKWTEEDITKYQLGTCQCHKCQHFDTPSKVWGEVSMYTATHVVFDDPEARHTTCKLFFDSQDSPLVTLDGWMVHDANIAEDLCKLDCMSCDVDLLDTLYKIVSHRADLWMKVIIKYKRSREKDKITIIASHPHGCPKQISVGHWINRYKVSDNKTKFTYTTCTCPGSSGAYVYSLDYGGWLSYDRHVHSGVNSEGINFTGTGRECSVIDNL